MKIALVRPYYNSYIITPPLGLGYLSSYLKNNGVETILIDALREELDEENLVERIVNEKPDAVGITCLTAFYNQVISLSKKLKGRQLNVIIGGVHPTFLPYRTLLDSDADFVICGEGEIPLMKLVKSRFNTKGIKGVYSVDNFKKGEGQIIKADPIDKLDSIPFPDWYQMDPNLYKKAPHGLLIMNYPIGVITATRGCPYECTFCSSPGFCDRKVRFRSIDNIIKEIVYLKENFGVKEIHFEDDNLTLKRDFVIDLCNRIVEEELNITWACPNGIRADKVDRNLIRLMRRSGCYYFSFGIESANSDILKNARKRVSVDVIEKGIRIANEEGISTQGFFIFGLPGETKETIEETIRFAKRSRLARAQFAILDVLPGSELWYTLEGKFEANWSKNSYKDPEWIPDGLTREDLIQAQSKAMRSFYLRPAVVLRLIRHIRLRQIKNILKRLREQRVFKVGIKNKAA